MFLISFFVICSSNHLSNFSAMAPMTRNQGAGGNARRECKI